MKAAEILRKLADMIDNQSEPVTGLEPVDVDHTDNTEAPTMVPPLQAKLELLKKSVGVDNVYDREDCDCGCDPCECGPDELDTIKKHAGIPVIVQHEAAEDNDITG
jgi:hypothetical protein